MNKDNETEGKTKRETIVMIAFAAVPILASTITGNFSFAEKALVVGLSASSVGLFWIGQKMRKNRSSSKDTPPKND